MEDAGEKFVGKVKNEIKKEVADPNNDEEYYNNNKTTTTTILITLTITITIRKI